MPTWKVDVQKGGRFEGGNQLWNELGLFEMSFDSSELNREVILSRNEGEEGSSRNKDGDATHCGGYGAVKSECYN